MRSHAFFNSSSVKGPLHAQQGEGPNPGQAGASQVESSRTRGTGHKLAHRRFCLTTGHHFCAVQVMEHTSRLPRSCGVASLEMSRSRLATALSTLLGQSWARWAESPSSLSHPAVVRYRLSYSEHRFLCGNGKYRSSDSAYPPDGREQLRRGQWRAVVLPLGSCSQRLCALSIKRLRNCSLSVAVKTLKDHLGFTVKTLKVHLG